jgi:hypothetical protein
MTKKSRKNITFAVSDLPPHILALNPELKKCDGIAKTQTETPAGREKTDDGYVDMGSGKKSPTTQLNAVQKMERRMTKTEARFYELLKSEYANEESVIIPQPTRFFRFDNGDTYTPDFIVLCDTGMLVYEVKGGYKGAGYEQGYERFFRAKEKFESYDLRITFFIVTWNRDLHQWDYGL